MTRLIRTELFKLTSTRSYAGMVAAAGGITALVTILTASRAGSHHGHMVVPPLYTFNGLHDVLTRTGPALILAMVFGAVIASGEFRFGTATGTYLATPKRTRVLAAKSVAGLVSGATIGGIGAAVATTVGLAFVHAHGYPTMISGISITRYALGCVLAGALLGAAGVAVGSLIRSQLVASVSLFAFGFVVEEIIGGLYNGAAPYLPFTAATTLAGAHPVGGVAALPFAAATALVAAVAVAIAVLASRTTVRQDIT